MLRKNRKEQPGKWARSVVPCVLFCVAALAKPLVAWAQPMPGDVFREYLWTNEKGDCRRRAARGGAGRLRRPCRSRCRIAFDLTHATKAES